VPQTAPISLRKANSARPAVITASVTLIMVVLAGSSAMAQPQAQSGDTSVGLPGARPKHKPIDLEIEAPSLDFMLDITKVLNDFHDEYRGFKKELRRDYDLHYSMQVSIIPQWGTPHGGPGVVQLVYTPNMIRSKIRRSDRARSLLRCSKPSFGRRPLPHLNKLGSA
jgi:hypothetical protein